jgi:two-component system, LytTR family, sensor histidine kinase AlgZ
VQDSELLSAYQDGASKAQAEQARLRAARERERAQAEALKSLEAVQRSKPAVLIFDACHVGVVLRAVLFVQAAVLVAVGFGTDDFEAWLFRLAFVTAGAIVAVLLWLCVACMLKKHLAKLHLRTQVAAGIAMGIAAALYGVGVLHATGLMRGSTPWVSSAAAGAWMSAVLIAGLIWRAKARIPADTAARLVELQSRIRPHFLFNALNSAIALVRDDPKRAEAVLEDLSEVFRHALASSQHAVSLGDELDVAQRYLAIEQVRFGERMKLEWSIDHGASHAKVPPLVLQPLVENAVKHGVEASPQVCTIKVSTTVRNGRVIVRVTNTMDPSLAASAAPKNKGNGMALANVRERLQLLHDVEARFEARAVDGLFQARMEFPLEAV